MKIRRLLPLLPLLVFALVAPALVADAAVKVAMIEVKGMVCQA